jgi:hypothetical protein
MNESDFYQQRDYWSEVLSNLSGWLGVPVTTVDFFLLLPLVPVIPILATWWLPWECWLWKHLPKGFLGAYLLYCSVVLWHLHAH